MSATTPVIVPKMPLFELSDDEDEKAPLPEQWQDFELRFGKYNGQTLGSISKTGTGRSYLRYLLSWPELRAMTRDYVEQALASYDAFKSSCASPVKAPRKAKRKRSVSFKVKPY